MTTKGKLTKSQIFEFLEDHFGLGKNSILESSRLEEGLGLDSLDKIELLMELEDKTGYEVPDKEAVGLKTVGDVLSYLKSKGFLEP